ncbi:OTU-like cysteine protease [Aspergillus sclerotioniger CBS 115572]|uniref:OTU-like cysteine protease n=1 Tax=Aspergillus sclerotioniger CBS 115572 TaxID=1450535 RepID=A0A317XDA8_9EURO|nr:OTU-like cysteine protease [Aspergillus sclerotioniger CBS 115572]PWY96604.1 OTU-like cysteine protease [Aspergillus sclerotioniger CBS 115572]
MADVPNGGRIVPIVTTARQHYSSSPTNEVMVKTPQQPSEKVKLPRNTRSKTMEAETLEIPCLNELGLYALPTEGDGNCLYYALSDQLYGDFTHADQIRDRLADHISANKDYFMSFIAAAGGERRAPRRAAAAAARQSYCSSSSSSPAPPSAKDKERSFDSKVAESRKKGVWGGAEEIQAFCQSFKRDVNVYTMYGIQNFRDVHAPATEEREIVHIAFHDFHHYSSVRHSDGPHTGLPCIPKVEKEREKEASAAKPTIVDMATPWKISAIQAGLGGKFDQSAIVEMLQQCRGNIDRAFMNLLGEDNNTSLADAPSSKAIMKSRLQPSSRSSSPFSTGSKRSADESDADDNPRPAVRRTRARENKRRILPDVTVGIAFRDDQNDLVSLRLRVSPETVVQTPTIRPTTEQAETSSFESATDSPDLLAQDKKLRIRPKVAPSETPSQSNDSSDDRKPPRRSQRLSRSRTAPRSS